MRMISTCTPDEREVAAATRRVEGFIDRLIDAPIDVDLYADLQRFLDHDAYRAIEARDRLLAQGPSALHARAHQIMHRTSGRAS